MEAGVQDEQGSGKPVISQAEHSTTDVGLILYSQYYHHLSYPGYPFRSSLCKELLLSPSNKAVNTFTNSIFCVCPNVCSRDHHYIILPLVYDIMTPK